MEQGRILLAIALSFAVFLVWEIFFAERPAVEPPVQQTEAVVEKGPGEKPAVEAEKSKQVKSYAAQLGEEAPIVAAKEPANQVVVETPLYTAVLSEDGATIRSWKLKQYRETVDKDAPAKELVGKEIPGGTVQMSWLNPMPTPLEGARFRLGEEIARMKVSDVGRSVRFTWRSPQGIRVEKAYSFSPETYLVDLTVTVQNGSKQPIQNSLGLSLVSRFEDSARAIGFQGASALVGDSVEQIDVGDVGEENPKPGQVRWMSLQHRYFLTALMPVVPVETQVLMKNAAPDVIESRYVQPDIALSPGTQQKFEYELFFGPKSMKVLGDIGHELDRVIDFGWFDFIAKPCLWLMNFIYRFIPNYGVAIICLTVITKILLWPLGNKSYKSMGEMKKIQPLMANVREKYKNDKKKMNQEMMALYKTYKINPMGGCLPMAAQIPVFIALYRMLYEAIELRHAPFFGWINDLSAPDRLFRFGFSVPFMQEPYGIPVLTLVMGASMLLQQKMSPPPGDPSQAKMMMLMPVVFTFIFINFPSGLVLYWLVNNLFSMGQQYFTQKKHS